MFARLWHRWRNRWAFRQTVYKIRKSRHPRVIPTSSKQECSGMWHIYVSGLITINLLYIHIYIYIYRYYMYVWQDNLFVYQFILVWVLLYFRRSQLWLFVIIMHTVRCSATSCSLCFWCFWLYKIQISNDIK